MRTVEDYSKAAAEAGLEEKAIELFVDYEEKYVASEKKIKCLQEADSMCYADIDNLRTDAASYKMFSWGYLNKSKEYDKENNEKASDFCKKEAVLWYERENKRIADCHELEESFSNMV